MITQLARHKVIPVIAIEHAEDAAPLADALITGGLPVAEITFRTSAAESAIRAMAKYPSLLLGAGTVLNVDTVKRAVDAGAKYVVSPGLDEAVVSYCLGQNIPIVPGAITPTEIQRALSMGLTTVKFFPADAFGGLKSIKALAAPLAAVRFIPTGGINAANLAEYLAFKPIIACGGSWVVTKDLLAAKNWSEITKLAAESVTIAQSVKS